MTQITILDELLTMYILDKINSKTTHTSKMAPGGDSPNLPINEL